MLKPFLAQEPLVASGIAVMWSFYKNIDLVQTLFRFRFLEEDVLEKLRKDM